MDEVNDQDEFSLIQECTDSYRVVDRDDGGILITIKVPKEFSNLLIAKLSDLTSTKKEIEEYEDEN